MRPEELRRLGLSENAVNHARLASSQASLTRSRLPLGNYGWLKKGLSPCPRLEEAELRALAATMTSGDSQEHPLLPAGYTYFGQLVNHDLSFQSATVAQRRNDPDALHNFRTPALDLDCVYDRGPIDQPYIYQLDDPWKLLTGRTEDGSRDLPRNLLDVAIIGDPRNDENLLVSHFHQMLMEFHNRCVDKIEADGVTGSEVFERARELTVWHYQWVVLHDYLRRVLEPSVRESLLGLVAQGGSGRTGLRHFVPSVAPYLPHEFVGAAFRFGHSMVRDGYALNEDLRADRKGEPVPLFAEGEAKDKQGNSKDLRGGRKVPDGWYVDPGLLLDFGDAKYQRALKIDTHLTPALERMPFQGRAESLAYLDLYRCQMLRLPSGQDLARAMGFAPFDAPGMPRQAPLWYYLLQEAEIQQGGLCLGEMGSTIVGEVIVGLVLMDPASYPSRDPAWVPVVQQDGPFDLTALARFAFDAGPA